MLVCKAVIDRLRRIIFISGMSLSLLAQEQTGRVSAAALDRVLAAGQMEQARQALDQMLACPHVDLEVLLETGAKLADRDLFEMARAAFARAVMGYPRSFEARYKLALANFALGRFSEAQITLDGNAGVLSHEQQLSREYLRGKFTTRWAKPIWPKKVSWRLFTVRRNRKTHALDLGLYYLRRHSSCEGRWEH